MGRGRCFLNKQKPRQVEAKRDWEEAVDLKVETVSKTWSFIVKIRQTCAESSS